MIQAALAAAEQIFSPPFRAVFWKSLGLTILLLGIAIVALERLVIASVHLSWTWLATLINVLAGIGLTAAAVFLIPTVSFVVASFFFDEMADHVEAEAGPAAVRGRAMALLPALWIGLKFSAVSLLVYAAALALLLLVPGINAVIFFGANAYLFGRGFFELAALRYMSFAEMQALRHAHGTRILAAGCVVAALSLVPLVNLVTPLFATAYLVRVTQPLAQRRLLQSAAV